MLDINTWKERANKILALDSHPRHIAAGFAVGVFISITPFFGIHTPMAIAAAFVFRLNKLTCITGAWVNTPLTVLPVLGLSYKIGQLLLGHQPGQFRVKNLEWAALKKYAASLILGSSILGFIFAIAGYFLCYWLIVKFRSRDEALDELTREMEETGETLEE